MEIVMEFHVNGSGVKNNYSNVRHALDKSTPQTKKPPE